MYKYEMHCHTSQVSRCSSFSAGEMAEYYKENGYDGIVITDHYNLHTFLNMAFSSPEKMADHFLSGYKKALEYADDDFTVLPGMELRFWYNLNDYLVYGISEELLLKSPNLMTFGLEKFYEFAEENGLLVIQAHPFRSVVFPANTAFLHGGEIYNGKEKSNLRAVRWAEENDLKIRLSGSDCHRKEDALRGGIITEKKIRTNEDLINILKNGEYELVKS